MTGMNLYRNRSAQLLGITKIRRGAVTWIIVGASISGALWQRFAASDFFGRLVGFAGLSPSWHDGMPLWLRPLASVFLFDGEALHFLPGLFWLILFGPKLESALGHLRYVILLAIAAYAAAAVELFAFPDAGPIVGSGGIGVAVLGASLLLRSRDLVVIRSQSGWAAPIPATYLAIGCFLFDAALTLDQLRAQPQSNAAYTGHLSGFVVGAVAAAVFKRLRNSAPEGDPSWDDHLDLSYRSNAGTIVHAQKSMEAWQDRRTANRRLAIALGLIAAAAAAIVLLSAFPS